MKMNKIYILSIITIAFISSCSKELPTDALLVPPKFDEMPSQAELGGKKREKFDIKKEDDVNDLKDLLLD